MGAAVQKLRPRLTSPKAGSTKPRETPPDPWQAH